MTPPFGLTHPQFFDLREDRAQFVLDRLFEVFSLQA